MSTQIEVCRPQNHVWLLLKLDTFKLGTAFEKQTNVPTLFPTSQKIPFRLETFREARGQEKRYTILKCHV
jgi:hypothetical protein